jgi:hypothetical protein
MRGVEGMRGSHDIRKRNAGRQAKKEMEVLNIGGSEVRIMI